MFAKLAKMLDKPVKLNTESRRKILTFWLAPLPCFDDLGTERFNRLQCLSPDTMENLYILVSSS
jgi:hypothetical protein